MTYYNRVKLVTIAGTTIIPGIQLIPVRILYTNLYDLFIFEDLVMLYPKHCCTCGVVVP